MSGGAICWHTRVASARASKQVLPGHVGQIAERRFLRYLQSLSVPPSLGPEVLGAEPLVRRAGDTRNLRGLESGVSEPRLALRRPAYAHARKSCSTVANTGCMTSDS